MNLLPTIRLCGLHHPPIVELAWYYYLKCGETCFLATSLEDAANKFH